MKDVLTALEQLTGYPPTDGQRQQAKDAMYDEMTIESLPVQKRILELEFFEATGAIPDPEIVAGFISTQAWNIPGKPWLSANDGMWKDIQRDSAGSEQRRKQFFGSHYPWWTKAKIRPHPVIEAFVAAFDRVPDDAEFYRWNRRLESGTPLPLLRKLMQDGVEEAFYSTLAPWQIDIIERHRRTPWQQDEFERLMKALESFKVEWDAEKAQR